MIAGSYSIFILDGRDGTLVRRIDPEGGRIWPGIVLADLDTDGDVDGADLADYLLCGGGVTLSMMAGDFGNVDCQ